MRALAIVCALAATAAADPEGEFRAAEARAAAGDPGAIEALEALGAVRPISAWSDDAWSEAARLAERTGDYDRARRDLEQVVAIGSDDRLVQRARAGLARLAASAGASGEWSKVAAEHDRLAARILAGGDPQPALGELEALVRANPAYPRATLARLVIAQGHERDGDGAAATAVLRDAVAAARTADERTRARLALIRLELRRGELDAAARDIDAVAASTEPRLVAELRGELATGERRRILRVALWALLGLALLAAAIALRRDAGSWRAAVVALARPPMEALFLAPIAIVLVAIAATGNPMVSRAVRAIAIAGIAVAWLSGASLEAARRRGALRAPRAIVYAVASVVVVLAAAYLVLDHDRMIDLVVETWRDGPAPR